SRTILLVPWARASQRDTQPAMDRSIRTIAKDLGVAVAPVGLAWRIAQERAPGLTLYLPDQRHPAPIGSYIAACVIYLVITSSGESCPPIPVISASAGDIAVAQYAAVRALRMRPVNKRR
ncbi:MAG TPA: hypothetical protein VME47_23305, partial [Acetobacteraceae bacterium]|nr:hypothetical protein [Acetobacteraceae bacterium]